ncbi:MAG: spermidine/putrescine ABC transporter substrate-binding protein [Actinomycetota bacterium]
MTQPDEQVPQVSPEMQSAFMRGMTQRRMSRRNMIKYAGMSVGTLSLASILAACGGDTSSTTGTDGAEPAAGASVDFGAEPGTEINFANWPLYIDTALNHDTGEKYHPSLDTFKEDTGITVNFEAVINDNASFFGELLPQLQAGQDTGWDIMVITNGTEFVNLTQNGWVTELDPSMRPNFDENAAPFAKDPAFDPGNKYSMCWQSGLTGIGYSTEDVARPVVSLDDLANPDVVGTNSVSMLKADMPDVVMINLGIDPKVSTPDDWKEAAAWLQMQKDSGTVRAYTGQEYIDDFLAGNTKAVMAWSGDILYYKIWEKYHWEFVVPEPGASTPGGGSLLWIDNMLIPANSANPAGALQLMDYVYKPEIAQLITEWVAYMSPVSAVRGLIQEHAKTEPDNFTANALKQMADSPLLWPDEEMLSKVSFGRALATDEERDEWNSIFLPISES